MALLYWALISKLQDDIAGGFTITTISDVACHMWLRHTLVAPQKHPKPVFRRGLFIMSDARFCFVAFDDLEQNEAGDTYVHTFTWTGWESCQTRYFYFWATNSGEPMHSTSPIFSKHYLWEAPPPPHIYYPDPHPEVTTLDGHTRVGGYYLGWPALVGAAGDGAMDSAQTFDVSFTSTIYTNYWGSMHRATLLFDLSDIPPGTPIISAQLTFMIDSMINTFASDPAVAVYESFPDSNTTLVKQDYQHYNDTILSDKIAYSALSLIERNQLTLNPAGLALIIPGQIAKLALREANFDAPHIDPGWESNKDFYVHIWAAEKGDPYKPQLEVTF